MSDAAGDEIYWPSLLREVKERFGLAAALKLAGECGGRSWSLPRRAAKTHPIARAAGVEVLDFLIRTYRAGEKIIIPLGPLSSYRKQIALIRRLVDQGAATTEIIRLAACHERTVRRHRNRARRPAAEGAQRRLFA